MFGEIASSVIGGVLGYKGVGDTNTANKDIATARNLMEVEEAKKARDFSAGQSQIGRDFTSAEALKLRNWQEHMSNTAVSRRMADMKKAGINPILAGKFDASSPAGAMGAHAQPATAKANIHGYTAQNKLQGLMDNLGTALSLKKLHSEIKSIEAATAFTGRKKDLTEPLNRIMGILDKMIEGGVGSANEMGELARQTRNDIKAMLKLLTGQKQKEIDEIRNAPGIEVTPHVKESQGRLRYNQSRKNRSKNRSRGR